jgi:hypothetical protein
MSEAYDIDAEQVHLAFAFDLDGLAQVRLQ